MNKIFHIWIIFLLFTVGFAAAQTTHADKYVKSWKITDKFASVDSVSPDTAFLNFHLDNHLDRFSIANAYRANLGSAVQSKIFSERPESHDFIFSNAYYPYINQINTARFYETNIPYSSLYYLSGGTNYYEDEQFRFLFTVNPNKKLNFGTTLDYLYARGEYQNLATNRFAGSLFASYNGERYKFTAFLASNTLNSHENGGIKDATYINGNINYPSYNIPVNIDAYSKYRHNQLFYNQQYNLGFYRNDSITKDSVLTSWVPVTIFAHTLQVDDYQKWYYEESVEKSFYKNSYLNQSYTDDTASMLLISNRFSISMAEEFNKWLNFGMSAYLENDLQHFGFMQDTALLSRFESNTRIGGVLSKRRSRVFQFNTTGELNILGPKFGDFKINGNLGGYFKFGKQRIELLANGFIKSVSPSYFYQYYQSNHFRWENDFDKTYTTHLGGKFSIPTQSLELNIAVDNIGKYIYFDEDALPKQDQGNIQVIVAGLKKDFHLGKFTLENNIIYQLSSNQNVLPLPDLSLYLNVYYHDLWFKVLSVQLGSDVRYHTSYYVPAYMPATGQFFLQTEQLIGNYPQMNVYLNAHLKRTRFFIQYYHINQLFMKGDYFSMPDYPINPAILKLGLTWNFYD